MRADSRSRSPWRGGHWGSGEGTSKQQAEKHAAQNALDVIRSESVET